MSSRRSSSAGTAICVCWRAAGRAGPRALSLPRRRRDDARIRQRHLAAGPRAVPAARGCPEARVDARAEAREPHRETACRRRRVRACSPERFRPRDRARRVEPRGLCRLSRLKLRAAHEDERALTARAAVQSVSDGFLAGARRADQQQRLGARRLSRDCFAEGANRVRCRRGAGRRRGSAHGSGDLQRRAARARAPPCVPRRALRARHWPPGALRLRAAARRTAARCGSRSRSGSRRSSPGCASCSSNACRTGLSIENTPMSSSRIRSGIAIWLSAFGRPGTGTASPISSPRPDFIICRRCAEAYARCCPGCPAAGSCASARRCRRRRRRSRTRPPMAWFS